MIDSAVDIFHRPELAARLTRRLLKIADAGCRRFESSLRSGMFLTGLRGIGKTTFLMHDLMPALAEAGALVIFVTLADSAGREPSEALLIRIREALEASKSSVGAEIISRTVRLLKSGVVEFAGLTFSFPVDRVGQEGGVTLADALCEVVEKAKTDVVLIVDEVQELSRSPAGKDLLWHLKAARDMCTHKGKFLFIGAGSHPAMIDEMVTDGNAAFRGAKKIPYPVLGSDYVEFALKVFEKEGATKLPSLNVAVRAFEMLGNEPDELEDAIGELQDTSSSATLDESFMEMAERRAIDMAYLEFDRVQMMGCIAIAIFTRISSDGEELGDPLSPTAMGEYSKAEGREVKIPEALSIVNALVAANLITRINKFCYRITNPLARELWREKQKAVK